MAKSKKNIDAFQKAMLTNTKMIGIEKKEKASNKIPEKALTNSEVSGKENIIEVDKNIYNELVRMSKEYQIEPGKIANLGIKLFLSYEDFWFDSNN